MLIILLGNTVGVLPDIFFWRICRVCNPLRLGVVPIVVVVLLVGATWLVAKSVLSDAGDKCWSLLSCSPSVVCFLLWANSVGGFFCVLGLLTAWPLVFAIAIRSGRSSHFLSGCGFGVLQRVTRGGSLTAAATSLQATLIFWFQTWERASHCPVAEPCPWVLFLELLELFFIPDDWELEVSVSWGVAPLLRSLFGCTVWCLFCSFEVV